MQKFILLRGHQGSGKSTFAEQKIAEFQKEVDRRWEELLRLEEATKDM